MGKSYTFERKEMEEIVIDAGKTIIQMHADKFLRGMMDFDMWHNVSNWDVNKLIDVFCEKCSDYWLDNHPDIDDVLLHIADLSIDKNTCHKIPYKIWVCSK